MAVDNPPKNGHFLTAFLCRVEIPPSLEPSESILDHPAFKFHLLNADQSNLVKNYVKIAEGQPGASFKTFLNFLQEAEDRLPVSPVGRFFLNHAGICSLLLDPDIHDEKLLNQLVKLPDVLLNAFYGDLPNGLNVESIVATLFYNLTLTHFVHIVASQSGVMLKCDNLSFVVGSAVMNHALEENSLKKYFKSLLHLAQCPMGSEHFANVFALMAPSRQSSFVKAIFRHTETAEEVYPILCLVPAEKLKPIFVQLILARSSFGSTEIFSRLICFLSLALDPGNFVQNVFVPVLTLWSDPIISRARVKEEVLHYSKLIVVIFSHIKNENLSSFKSIIIQQIVRGMPNHFSSTDPRTVILAKYICEFITETFKLSEGQIQQVPDEVKRPCEDLPREILAGFHLCKTTSQFWYAQVYKADQSEKAAQVNLVAEPSAAIPKEILDEDDDDDDDLEAIDSLDPPASSKVIYIRDFLEGLPESKSYDETKTLFSALPTIIQHQICYEHPQVGKDLLDVIFGWENSFESPDLDELKKTNLCLTLQTKLEGNLEHLCSYFRQASLQAYKRNQILDVLTNVSQNVSLKDLGYLAKVSFADILTDPEAIERQETICRIPMILFFQKLLCSLPHEMVREEMVTSYLNALTRLRNVDGATQQTIQYSMHNVMKALEGVPLTRDIRSSIVCTRNWLWGLEN